LNNSIPAAHLIAAGAPNGKCPESWHPLDNFSVIAELNWTAKSLLFIVFVFRELTDCDVRWVVVQCDCHLAWRQMAGPDSVLRKIGTCQMKSVY